LGLKDDSLTPVVAKRMVDHALQNGWDSRNGGFFDEAYYFKNSDKITITSNGKNWWAQAEGLNTLLLMADLYPDDPMRYFEKFKKMWKYIQTYLIDDVHGDFFPAGLDTRPLQSRDLKGHIWKANYHQLRSLSNCMNRLRKQIN
jgi:mannobiose 2-epimerase